MSDSNNDLLDILLKEVHFKVESFIPSDKNRLLLHASRLQKSGMRFDYKTIALSQSKNRSLKNQKGDKNKDTNNKTFAQKEHDKKQNAHDPVVVTM